MTPLIFDILSWMKTMHERSKRKNLEFILPALAPLIIPAANFDMPGWMRAVTGAMAGFAIIIPLTLSAVIIALCSKKGVNGFVKMFLAGLVMSFAGMFLEVFLVSLAERAHAPGVTEQLTPRTPYTWLGMMFLCGALWQIFIGFDSGYRERRHRKAPLEKKDDEESLSGHDEDKTETEPEKEKGD